MHIPENAPSTSVATLRMTMLLLLLLHRSMRWLPGRIGFAWMPHGVPPQDWVHPGPGLRCAIAGGITASLDGPCPFLSFRQAVGILSPSASCRGCAFAAGDCQLRCKR